MPKTLLLCFIHGFKGDEETFFDFPSSLKDQVSTQCPDLDVQTRVYPKYETRGDLAGCVETFKEWLQEQVVTIETKSGNKSAISNPDVGVVIVAHSMGGFVAADTLFSILDNRPMSQDEKKKLMFPLIHGVLLFDSPLNGLARSMFAYGAFAQYQNISSVYSLLSTVGSSLAIGGASASSAPVAASASSVAAGAGSAVVASQASSWRRWQALASRTGAYGAIMAGGVAAYVHREQIYKSLSNLSMPTTKSVKEINYRENLTQGLTYVSRDAIGEGFTWMASHLKFVGALMKTGQLTTRLERLEGLEGIGVVNLYASLGENGVWNGGYFVPKRTFCAVPSGKDKEGGMWREVPNPKAENEIFAHCNMFKPERNQGYEAMLESARGLVCEWIKMDSLKVKDEYKPSREVLHRSMSEHKLWDDDGKVLEPVPPSEGADEVKGAKSAEQGSVKEETEDEMQLEAILKCADMPLPEGADEASMMEALGVPLPVDEEIDASTKVMGQESETKTELPTDKGAVEETKGETASSDAQQKESKPQATTGWFKNPLPTLYGGKKAETTESTKEGPTKESDAKEKPAEETKKGTGYFKNPLPMLYSGHKGEVIEPKDASTAESASSDEKPKEEEQKEKPAGTGAGVAGYFKNPLPMLYGGKKTASADVKEEEKERSTDAAAEDKAGESKEEVSAAADGDVKAKEEKEAAAAGVGGYFKNPLPMLYGGKKEAK